MSPGYQTRDRELVDYQLWRPTPACERLRGPALTDLCAGSYFACVGAAQTFGCFCPSPWPALLAAQLSLPALNLGIAGAGPALFRGEPYRTLLANARFVVFQVMSGRSADCSRFHSGGRERLRDHTDGSLLGADQAWTKVLQADLEGVTNPLLRHIKNRVQAVFGRREARLLVAETRADWVEQFTALLAETAAPKVLLWFSRRPARYRLRYHSLQAMFGEFPQLIDEAMFAAVAQRADHSVVCVTSRGSPQPLAVPVRPADAGTGEPADVIWTHNAYYPSPEMHEDAVQALLDVCRPLAAPTPAPPRPVAGR